MTFDFDLISGSFLAFWGPNRLFLRLGSGSITFLASTYINNFCFLRFALFLFYHVVLSSSGEWLVGCDGSQ